MSTLWQDLKQAPRTLLRQPMIAIIAVITLALAIGANTAIYTVLDATLLSPPPYKDPDRIVAVWGVMPARDIDEWPSAPPDIVRYQREGTQFEDFAGFTGGINILREKDGSPQQVTSIGTMPNLLSLLGVKPMLGRDLNAEDARFNASEVPAGAVAPNDVFNNPRTALISWQFWQRQFGGRGDIIGHEVIIDDTPATIVGVMPRDFEALLPGGPPAQPDLLLPLRIDMERIGSHNVFMTVVARLKDGVSLAQARAELDAISQRMAAEDPVLKNAKWHNRLLPLQEELTQDISAFVLVLGAAVGLVLLIACANVANLLLVRATGQVRDSAIRTALGGSQRRLVQRSLIETGVLVLVATALGIAIAWVSLPAIIALQPQNLPQLVGIGIDGTVLAFCIGVTAIVTLVAGLAPALSLTRLDLVSNLRERNAVFESRASRRWRNVLIAGEVAIAFTLLVGAGLMLRSFAELSRRDPGFDPSNAIGFFFPVPAQRYGSPEAQEAVRREFHRRASALPGVVSVTAASNTPLDGGNFGSRYAADLATFHGGSARQAQYRIVYPGFFATMRGTILQGREFTWADEDASTETVVVDDALAARAWPGESPLGKTLYIRRGTPEVQALTVIGVTRHMVQNRLNEEPGEVLYFTRATAQKIGFGGGLGWIVRADIAPDALRRQLEATLHEIDPELPMINVQTLETIVANSTAPTRFAMTLLGLFAGLALVLAVVGLYGLLAYRVRQRAPELGLRLTLGARRGQVFGMVVKQGLLLVAVGLAIGLAVAFFATRALTTQLVDVSATDPVTYLGITGVFLAIATIACMLPAWRATRVDPGVVLRND